MSKSAFFQCGSTKNKREFEKSQNISRHLFCSICHEVFEDPVRTGCGHTFCYICIQQWAVLQKKCPMCKTSVIQRKLEKDLIASQIIDDLLVRCMHQGCTWRGVYSVFKKHQRGCQYRPKKEFINDGSMEIVQVCEDNVQDENTAIVIIDQAKHQL